MVVASYLQDLGRMAKPALVQAAKTYGPAVTEGVKKGVKEGVLSIRNPQKASKYFSINSVEDLAKSPGNISAVIDENISVAVERSGSQTPFLNSLVGPGAGDKLHTFYYSNKKFAPSGSKKPLVASTVLTPTLERQMSWREGNSQKVIRYGEELPPELRPASPLTRQTSTDSYMRGGKRRTQRRRRNAIHSRKQKQKKHSKKALGH